MSFHQPHDHEGLIEMSTYLQPPLLVQRSRREGGPALNGCLLYICVPSTGGDSAGAPTGITTLVMCGVAGRTRPKLPER